jgi:hypothetical protein
MSPVFPGDESEKPKPFGTAVSLGLFALAILVIIGFDQVKLMAGRAYYEFKMPKTVNVESVKAALGQPDKTCDRSKECDEFLKAFIFRNSVPKTYTSYFAYSDHYPALPFLVFFLDDKGEVASYDYGVN